MAYSSISEPDADYDDYHYYVDHPVDVSGWTNCQDSDSHQKRSDIFHEMIQNHCVDQLRNIVESGWNVNEELNGCHPHQPLLHAIIHSKKDTELLKIVQLLLEHGANPNIAHKVNIAKHGEATWVDRTALHEAARLGWTGVVKILLDAGAKCTSDGLQNPLALAIQRYKCSPDLIELLLQHGADPNDHDDQRENIPLLRAMGEFDHDNLPMRYGNNYDKRIKSVRLLLKHRANPNVAHTVNIAGLGEVKWVQRTALDEAIRLEAPDMVKLLLDAGATLDALQSPLVLAINRTSNPLELIKLLLKHGADPNDHDDQLENIPLLAASKKDRYTANHGTAIVQLLLEYGANPNVAPTVNIARHGETKYVQRTALLEAASQGWTELVKILLDAGAKCTTSKGLQNPLALALVRQDCTTDLIELLLKHGADPNDHDDQLENIPLLVAIKNKSSRLNDMSKMLEHGADPNVAHTVNRAKHGETKWVHRTALHEAASQRWTEGVKVLLDAGAECVISDTVDNPLALALQGNNCPPDLIQLLLERGAYLHYVETEDEGNGPMPLLHRLTQFSVVYRPMFLQQQLDLVFLHGGNINMEDGDHRTALDCANGHSYSVRWLIRHGADVSQQLSTLEHHFTVQNENCLSETPLILLQAGMRVSDRVHKHLRDIEVAIIPLLQDDSEDDFNPSDSDSDYGEKRPLLRWDLLMMTEEEELQRVPRNLKKRTFLEYCTQQMADLQEFSDESLQNYPEDTHTGFLVYIRPKYQYMLDQIHRVQEFLSQPQSLQWYCRCCVRENLVSLQPTVVKSLSIPAVLKRYILCHEI